MIELNYRMLCKNKTRATIKTYVSKYGRGACNISQVIVAGLCLSFMRIARVFLNVKVMSATLNDI